MRSPKFLFAFAAATCLLFAVSSNGYAQAINTIVLAKVSGSVNIQDSAGTRPAANGNRVTQGSYVITGPVSSATLLFSNGSTVTVNENTRMEVSQFFQDSHDNTGFPTGRSEPSRSTTRLKLDYGEIIGSTKKLNSASVYEINTPVGIAGIRGTTWYAKVVEITADTLVALFGVIDGQVDFTPTGKTVIHIDGGKQVEIKLTKLEGGGVSIEIPAAQLADLPEDVRIKAKAILDQANKDLIDEFSADDTTGTDEDIDLVRASAEAERRVTDIAGENAGTAQ